VFYAYLILNACLINVGKFNFNLFSKEN